MYKHHTQTCDAKYKIKYIGVLYNIQHYLIKYVYDYKSKYKEIVLPDKDSEVFMRLNWYTIYFTVKQLQQCIMFSILELNECRIRT